MPFQKEAASFWIFPSTPFLHVPDLLITYLSIVFRAKCPRRVADVLPPQPRSTGGHEGLLDLQCSGTARLNLANTQMFEENHKKSWCGLYDWRSSLGEWRGV